MFKKLAMVTAAIIASCCMAATAFADVEILSSTEIPITYQVTEGVEVNSVFTLEAKNGAPMPDGSVNGKKEVVLKKSGPVDFGVLKYSRPDIYEYTLTKETDHIEGLTKDDTTYNVYVMATHDGQANVILKNKKTGEKPAEILYIDVVIGEPYDDPPVLKRVDGNAPKAEEFSFKLKSLNEGQPMPEGAAGEEMIIKTLPEAETEFGRITFTKEGGYDYEISEIDTGLANYKYDTTVYKLHYEVTNKDGELSSKRTVTKDGEEVFVAVFSFTNGYFPPVTIKENTEPSENSEHSELYNKTIGRVAKTGDEVNMLKMAATLLIAAFGVMTYILIRRKEKNTEKK